ncbi:MAG: adenylate/guanylate cyclase domain-containing protein [Caldimonas sp.]
MAADDRVALRALDAARDVFRGIVQTERGRLIDMAGDSVLVMFESVAAAVQAALAVQRALAAPGPEGHARLAFRIGIHLGDVIEKADGSVYGDGVNIAARLQTLAPPGGIVVSQSVHGAVVGRVDARFRDLGEHAVKNIPRKVRALAAETGRVSDAPRLVPSRRFRQRRTRRFFTVAGIAACVVAVVFGVRWFRETGTTAAVAPATVRDAVVGKSVAVLPFDSVGGGDKETESIADGISDELIATLSGVPGLRLSARTSSFFFKGKQASTSEIASRLGVSYLVTGTVRRGEARLRIWAKDPAWGI